VARGSAATRNSPWPTASACTWTPASSWTAPDYGDDDSPYWSLIVHRGRPYLADDAGTDFADGAGGPLRVVREIEAPYRPCHLVPGPGA
jgi:hypothetical protein